MGSNCPICLEDLVGKVSASPDACDHVFCLSCLEKWSKLGSYCPVDRKRYKKIYNLNSDDVIQVKPRKRKRKSRAVYDFTSLCEVCSKDDKPDILLLCDCCDLSFHTVCLTPPLKSVPAGLWFCPTCIAVEKKLKDKKGVTKEVEAELSYEGISSVTKYNSKTEKKIPKKPQNEDIDNSILEACHNIISDFENITTKGNASKEASTSSILNGSLNKLDNIYKTFHSEASTCSQKHSKYSKKYNIQLRSRKNEGLVQNQILLNKVLEKKLKTESDKLCLTNTVSKGINIDERLGEINICYDYSPDIIYDGSVDPFCEFEIRKDVEEELSDKNKSCSFTNSAQLGELWKDPEINSEGTFPESTLQRETNCEEEIGNSPPNKNHLRENTPSSASWENSLKRKTQQSILKHVVTENSQDSLFSSKSISEDSPKGKYLEKIKHYWTSDDYQPTDILNSHNHEDYSSCLEDMCKDSIVKVEKIPGLVLLNFDIESEIKSKCINIKKENFRGIKKESFIGIKKESFTGIKKESFTGIKKESSRGIEKESSSDCKKASFTHNELKYLTILDDGTFFLNNTSSIDDKPSISPSQNGINSYHCNEYKTCKPELNPENSEGLFIKSEIPLDVMSPQANVKSEYFDGFKKESFSNSKNASFTHSDIQYLTILDDGTFFLEKPTSHSKQENTFHEDVRNDEMPLPGKIMSEIRSLQNSGNLNEGNENKAFYQGMGNRSPSNSLQNSENVDYYNKDKTFKDSHNQEMSFLERNTSETNPLRSSVNFSDDNEDETFYQNDSEPFTAVNDETYSSDELASNEDISVTHPLQNSEIFDSHYERKSFNREDLKYLNIQEDGTFVLNLSSSDVKPTSDEDKSVTDALQNCHNSHDRHTCYQNGIKSSSFHSDETSHLEQPTSHEDKSASPLPDCCYSDSSSDTLIYKLDDYNIKNEENFFLEKSKLETDKSLQPLQEPKNQLHSKDKIFHKSDLKYLTIKEDGSFILELPI